MAKIGLLILVALGIVFHLYGRAGFPYTHDGENHVARFADYAAAFRQGQIPPRIAPNIWSGVGYPVFNFNYPLSNILSLPFSALNIEYTLTFKLLAILYVIAGVVGIWQWLQYFAPTLTRQSRAIGILVWLSFPFFISTLYFRGNIGEIAAYGLLPWLFLGIELVRKKVRRSLVIVAATTGLFLLAHNIAAVFVWPLVLTYACYRFKDTALWWKEWILATALGGLTSMWFWLPAFLEKHHTVLDSAGNNSTAVEHAPNFWQLLSSPLAFGFSFPGSIDTLSFSLGITWVVLALGSFYYFRFRSSKQTTGHLGFLLIITTVIILLQLEPFARVWSAPSLHFIQFPWRLSLFLGFPVAGLAAIIWHHSAKPIKYFLFACLLVVFWEIWLLKPADYVFKTNEDFASFPHSTSTQNENRPATFTGLHGEVEPFATVTTGEGDVTILLWKGHEHTYEVGSQSEVIITEATMFFPGWSVLAHNLDTGETITPNIDPAMNKGWITYALPAGDFGITTSFSENTWPRILGDVLSIMGFLGIAMLPIILGRTTKD